MQLWVGFPANGAVTIGTKAMGKYIMFSIFKSVFGLGLPCCFVTVMSGVLQCDISLNDRAL